MFKALLSGLLVAALGCALPATPADADAGTLWPVTYVDGFASPGPIAYAPDGKTAYVANRGGSAGVRADEVQVVDVASRHVVATWQDLYAASLVNNGGGPTGIAVNAAGTKVYLGESDGKIAVFDVRRGQELGTIAVAAPYARAFTLSGSQGIVLASDGSLVFVSLTTGATLATVSVGPLYSADTFLTLSPDGRTVYVTQPHSSVGFVDAVDLVTYVHTRIATTLTQVNGLAVAPDSKTVYVSGETSTIVQIDVATKAVTRHDNVAGGTSLAISEDGHELYAGQHALASNRVTLNRVDTTLWSVTPVLAPASPQTGAYDFNLEAASGRPAVSPDGAHLLYAVADYGVAVFDVSGVPTFAGWVPSMGFTTGIAVPAVGHVAYIAGHTDGVGDFPGMGVGVLDTRHDVVTATIPILYGASAVGSSRDGKTVLALDYSGANLEVIDPASRSVVSVLAVPGGARDVLVASDGKRAYLESSSSILVVDTSGPAANDSIIGSFAIPTSGAHTVVLSPDGKRLYVIDDVAPYGLYAIDTKSGAVHTVNLKLSSHDWTAGLTVSPDSKSVYVSISTFGAGSFYDGKVQAVSAATLKRGKSVAFHQGRPESLLTARDGTLYVLTGLGSLEVLDFATGKRTVVGPYLDPRAAGPDGSVYGIDLHLGLAVLKAPKHLKATPRPRITGVLEVGHTLTAHAGTWKPAPVKLSYEWYAGGKRIAGATSHRLKLTGKQLAKTITVRVTGTKDGYLSVTKESPHTKKVGGS